MQMNIQDKKQEEWQNEDQQNKQKELCSWHVDKEDRRWQITIPNDILSIISDLLPLSDFINFRGVCQKWRRAPSCRSNITEFSKKDPWCILYDFNDRDKDMCLFYQCNNRRSCSVKLPGLRGAKCFVSKLGWLFIRRNNDYLLFNPLTLEEIFLPEYPGKWVESSACQVGTFSTSPSSPQYCVVVLLTLRGPSLVEIASCHLTAMKWVLVTVKFNTHGAACTPVLRPNPKSVFFKADYDDSQCPNHINCISICYDRYFLHFECSNKQYKMYSLSRREVAKIDNHLKNFKWYSNLTEAHSDDWICTFGKKFTFSFCLFNDFKRAKHKVFGSLYPTIPNIPVIKAALLYKD